MSAKSDLYEKHVAKNIDSIPGISATRPTVGTQFADVLLVFNGKRTWLEVKMSHTDNLSNPRMFYKNAKWQTTYKTPTAATAVEFLNKSPETKKFLMDISKYTGIPLKDLKVPTSRSGIKEPGAVPLQVFVEYFKQPGINRYILNQLNVDLGKVVTAHYTLGKAEPAYYMQAGDDFYRISRKDPYNLGDKIPLLSGRGDFRVRISTRSQFYEVQAEIKIKNMPQSRYSLAPGTKKLNPFLK